MDKLRLSINNWVERLETRWVLLPIESQRKIILYFFIGYILITLVTIVDVWHEVQKSATGIEVEHINLLPKIKVPHTTKENTNELLIFKDNLYERNCKKED